MKLVALGGALALAACGGGGGDTGNDGSVADDAPSIDALSLETPANTWTWVEIPGTMCANGTPAGFGVNRSTQTGGGDLFILFQGGGACWDGNTCFVTKTSAHIEDTYTQAMLEMELGGSVVNHADTTNPVAAATWIYIPYCTGDLHAGAARGSYDVNGTIRTVEHVGATNTQRFVDVLRASFPDAASVWITGVSAGGFGGTLNLHRFTAAWPGRGVHMLQDGAPFVPVLVNYATWQSAWSLQFPPGCTTCASDFSAVIDTVAIANPTSRIGLMTFDNDMTIRQYFGYTGSMVTATDTLLAERYDHANTKAFVVAGDTHTMLGMIGTLTGPGGVRLSDWVYQWVRGDAGWTTVR
jgi:hypothetical protein